MTASPKTALLVFVKFPEPGKVKTRLAQSIGTEKAAAVYRIFAETCLHNYQQVPDTDCIVYFAPANEKGRFVNWLGKHFLYMAQPEGGLGVRLSVGFQSELQKYSNVIALGTDSPDLPVDYIKQAVTALRDHSVVVGPSEDGGYYLIGMNADCTLLFEGINWSTNEVLAQTMAKAEEHKLSIQLLPEWYDVDTEVELQRFLDKDGEVKSRLKEIID